MGFNKIKNEEKNLEKGMPENDTSQNNESQRTLINNALQNATATKALTNEPSQPKKPTKMQ